MGGVEVGGEVAVEAGEDVEVEGGGHSGGIVVGGEEGGFVFVRAGGQVGAQQKGVAGLELGSEVEEYLAGLFGGEVADAGADVEGEHAGVLRADEGDGLGDVVGELGKDGYAGDLGFEGGLGFGEAGVRDVDGLVRHVGLAADGGAEEDAGLGRGAGAELGDGEASSFGVRFRLGGEGDDLVGVGGEEGSLGAGEVVLGELGDLLEEGGAGFVVEEPRGEGSGSGGEAGEGFVGDGFED